MRSLYMPPLLPLPVNLQRCLLGKSAEHTHEGDLVRETQPVVGAPPQGDLSSVGLEKGGHRESSGGGRRRGRRPARFCQEQGSLELGVSKTAIAKITGVSRTALYSFMRHPRAPESSSRDGLPGHFSVRNLQGARYQAGDALQVRRAAGTSCASRARRSWPPEPECSNCDAGGARVQP